MVGNLVRTLIRETTTWLRFYDSSGNLVLLPEEAAEARAEQERQQAEQERQRADRLAARLRELGRRPRYIMSTRTEATIEDVPRA